MSFLVWGAAGIIYIILTTTEYSFLIRLISNSIISNSSDDADDTDDTDDTDDLLLLLLLIFIIHPQLGIPNWGSLIGDP